MAKGGDGKFAIGTAAELQQRFGWTAENWNTPELRAEEVPEPLRDLLPLARRWGGTCDVTRHDIAANATEDELSYLSRALRDRHHLIEDWLYSTEKPESSTERAAFEAMVIFELEECDGPGLTGLLAWAVRWYKDAPSFERLERLKVAYQEVLSWKHREHLKDVLEAARCLIEESASPR